MITNETILTQKMIYQLSRYRFFKDPLLYLSIAVAIIYLLDSKERNARFMPLMIIALVISLLFMLYVLIFSPILQMRKSAHVRLEYSFAEDSCLMLSKSNETSVTETFQYNVVSAVYERKSCYYFEIHFRKYFIVDKDGFSEGAEAQLKNLLSEKLGKRFKPQMR